jgi:hypothetical protein
MLGGGAAAANWAAAAPPGNFRHVSVHAVASAVGVAANLPLSNETVPH